MFYDKFKYSLGSFGLIELELSFKIHATADIQHEAEGIIELPFDFKEPGLYITLNFSDVNSLYFDSKIHNMHCFV